MIRVHPEGINHLYTRDSPTSKPFYTRSFLPPLYTEKRKEYKDRQSLGSMSPVEGSPSFGVYLVEHSPHSDTSPPTLDVDPPLTLQRTFPCVVHPQLFLRPQSQSCISRDFHRRRDGTYEQVLQPPSPNTFAVQLLFCQLEDSR